MGILFSRQNARVEELDLTSSNAYRYPPKTGNYFATHFIMGGERFETTQPEAYLFGENMDLNFLGGRPTPFPYAAPQPNEPTRTLRSLINIRKESLRFVKAPGDSECERQEVGSPSTQYNIEFSFDSDVRCGISIYYFCTEEVTPNGVVYTPRDPAMNSETYHYKKGVNQQFSQVSHCFDPSRYSEEMLNYRFEDDIIPVLIQCIAEEGEEPRQAHMVISVVEKNSDGTYTLKPLKQKLFVDGLCYLLQEIYGIENKNVYQSKDTGDEDVEDNASECVICMSDARDTLILPCRHLCLCNSCADSLRYQANNCPICRAPFRALLQIRAVRKSNAPLPSVSHNVDNQPSQDIPPGFEPVSLIEALNGPVQPVPSFPTSGPPFPQPSAPPFSNSPDTQQKRHLERHSSNSSSSLRPADSVNSEKENSLNEKLHENRDESTLSEVVVATVLSPDKIERKVESLSLSRGEARRHRKGFRTSSAPEKIRLLTNSVQIVNEVGGAKRKVEKDDEIAETRSLLENSGNTDDCHVAAAASPKPGRNCNRGSPISLSTPHSLHLCDKSNKGSLVSDVSPGGEDSDYYTPEDPSTTILVDQGTDTSLDTPQGMEPIVLSDLSLKHRADHHVCGKQKHTRDHYVASDEPAESDIESPREKLKSRDCSAKSDICSDHLSHLSSNCNTLAVHLENSSSLPGTPASNSSNHSSGDSFSSTSSTRLLLQHQSYETLPE